MQCFYYSRFRTCQPHCRGPKFFLLSDLHFSPKVTQRTLDAIAKKVKAEQPDYITFAGDLVDSLEVIDDHAELSRLLAWLSRLDHSAPVLIALGNHDFYKKAPGFTSVFSRKKHWLSGDHSHLLAALHTLKNVHVLDNAAFEDNHAYILGLTPPTAYYQLDRNELYASTLLHPGNESRQLLLFSLERLHYSLIRNLPRRKAKIALIHSPVYLSDPEIAAFFDAFDFVICGHMHGGLVPPLLNELWPSDRGLASPGKRLFQRNSRWSPNLKNPKLIPCGAITAVQACAHPVSFLNAAFPVNIATLEYSDDERYAGRLDCRHKYLSF